MFMKSTKIIFWISTTIIFLMIGVITVVTFGSKESNDMMAHLGYPAYFAKMLMIFKVLGAIALIIPQIPNRIKEWAYAGITFDILAASYSICAVDGLGFGGFFPFIILGILAVSYFSHHKLQRNKSI